MILPLAVERVRHINYRVTTRSHRKNDGFPQKEAVVFFLTAESLQIFFKTHGLVLYSVLSGHSIRFALCVPGCHWEFEGTFLSKLIEKCEYQNSSENSAILASTENAPFARSGAHPSAHNRRYTNFLAKFQGSRQFSALSFP